jgi:pimeloyl-ACP methyl ester carboxylesterase
MRRADVPFWPRPAPSSTPGGQTVNAHNYLPDAAPIPTLIVWGSRDRMIPPWHAISAQKSIPGCRVELFEGAGHFPHLDEPDRFADLVRDFIATT